MIEHGMKKFYRELRLDYRLAALRVRIALLNVCSIDIKAGFRQDQPRADNGKWNGGRGSVIIAKKDKPAIQKLTPKQTNFWIF